MTAVVRMPETDTHFRSFWKEYQRKVYVESIQHVPKDRRTVAIDIGAHIGLWSRYMQEDFGTVIAYEPILENFRCLVVNTDPKIVRPFNLACGSVKTNIFMSNPAPTNSGAWQAGVIFRDNKDDTFESVPCVRLSEHFASLGLEDLAFVKIDVQGMELDVLYGAEALIKNYRPAICVESVHNNVTDYRIEGFLHKLGMTKIKKVGQKDDLYIFS